MARGSPLYFWAPSLFVIILLLSYLIARLLVRIKNIRSNDKEGLDMSIDTIWTIMTCIVYGFEIVGVMFIALFAMIMIFNTGNERIDRIRNYMLMIDEEDLE